MVGIPNIGDYFYVIETHYDVPLQFAPTYSIERYHINQLIITENDFAVTFLNEIELYRLSNYLYYKNELNKTWFLDINKAQEECDRLNAIDYDQYRSIDIDLMYEENEDFKLINKPLYSKTLNQYKHEGDGYDYKKLGIIESFSKTTAKVTLESYNDYLEVKKLIDNNCKVVAYTNSKNKLIYILTNSIFYNLNKKEKNND